MKKITFHDCDLLIKIAICGGWISFVAWVLFATAYLLIRILF